MTMLRKLVPMLVIVTLTLPASRATQGRGRGYFRALGSVAALLVNKGVHRELKVTDDQASKLEVFAKKYLEKQREELAKISDSPEDRRQKMAEVNRTLDEFLRKGLEEILSPPQIKRFNQIRLQLSGAVALQNPAVREGLKLSEGQKTQIDGIVEDARREMRESLQNSEDDREASIKKYSEARKISVLKAEAVLSDEQKKMWRELIGEPFEIKYERSGQEP